MKYALLIYWDEKIGAENHDGPDIMKACYDHNIELAKEGVFLEGAPLHFTPTAKTVRVRDGARIVSDGPFAETKEQLGGYTVLECRDNDHARQTVKETLEVQRNTSGGVELHELPGDE